MKILGVRIDEYSKNEISKKIEDFFVSGQHTIFTPNPEMLVRTSVDPTFKEALNSGEMNICDGRGLEFAAMLYGKKITRYPGVDLMLEICSVAAKNGVGVYLLGGKERSVVRECSEKLIKNFTSLKISGYDEGFDITIDPSFYYDNKINAIELEKISRSNAGVLFVAFGMVKQERWILDNIEKMQNIKLAIGVGGSFDYISEKIPRAPLLLRKVGLEWAYRLIVQPRRLGRIFNATIKFPFLVLKERFKL